MTDQYQTLLPQGLSLAIGDLTDGISERILSESEADEFSRIQHDGRKDEFLSSRSLVKKLAEKIGLEGEQFEILKDGLGKPFGIYRNRRYYLSMAHTGDKLLCGISSEIPVGVDMEPVDRETNDRLWERMLHPEERKSLEAEPLIRVWTLKEAMVKLEGKGLRTNLNRIRLAPENENDFVGRFHNDKIAKICSFQHDGYWISVARYQ